MGPSRKFPDGEIVGQSVDLGHILRANNSFEVPPDNWQTINTAIVGGGVAGLTAAWKFKRENFNDFVLLELEKVIGGTARSGQGEPVGYPWGAHYLPVPFHENADLISFLDEMSLIEGRDHDGELMIGEQYLCREPEERLFFKGRWYEGLYATVGSTDEERHQYNEFQKRIDEWVGWRDSSGKRAFVVPVGMASTD